MRQSANPTWPIYSTRRFAIYAGQVIERQGARWAETSEIGCSADQAYSQGRQCADNRRPSCSCAAKFAGRMASNTATGALSRTRGRPGARGAAARAVSWRDQRRAGVGAAAVDRGFGGRCRATADAVAVSGKTVAPECWRMPRSSRQAVAAQLRRPVYRMTAFDMHAADWPSVRLWRGSADGRNCSRGNRWQDEGSRE